MTTAVLASTEQVFHLSYRRDEGNRDSREQGNERGEFAGRYLYTKRWNWLSEGEPELLWAQSHHSPLSLAPCAVAGLRV